MKAKQKKTGTYALVMCLLAFAVVCFSEAGYKLAIRSHTQPTMVVSSVKAAPATPSILVDTPKLAADASDKLEVITLTDKNMAVLDQAFDDNSVTRVMLDLQQLSDKASASDTLYLVLNTPGGSVDAGQKLISFAKGLPQKVKTITIFAASMGFQTVQNLDERLILETGTLMSHRARFSVGGETVQIQHRLNYYIAMIDVLDATAADRMSMGFDEYKKLIHDEYWAFGHAAVQQKAADRAVLIKCDSGLKGTRATSVETMFGTFNVKVSKCPLLPGILGIEEPKELSDSDKKKANEYVRMMFTDRMRFTRDFIMTNKFMEFQK